MYVEDKQPCRQLRCWILESNKMIRWKLLNYMIVNWHDCSFIPSQRTTSIQLTFLRKIWLLMRKFHGKIFEATNFPILNESSSTSTHPELQFAFYNSHFHIFLSIRCQLAERCDVKRRMTFTINYSRRSREPSIPSGAERAIQLWCSVC